MESDSMIDGNQPYSPSATEMRRDRSRSPMNGNMGDDGRRRQYRQDKRYNRASSDRRVYVANIPFDCKWTHVKDLFKEKVGEVEYVELFEDEKGKFRGCGIVAFKDPTLVQKAIDILHRFDYKGRQLVVKEDFDVERDQAGRPITRQNRNMGGMGGGGGGGGPMNRGDTGGRMRGGERMPAEPYNTYGLSPQFLQSLGITGPLGCKVFVANLDFKVSSQKLEEVFRMAGKVKSVELKKDDEGNSKGHGIVEMGHPVEAVQAISMFNGQKLFGRLMSVRMDKKAAMEKGDKLPSGLEGIGKGLGLGGTPLNMDNPASVPTAPSAAAAAAGALPALAAAAAANLGLGATGLNPAAALGTAGLGLGLGAAGLGAGAANLAATNSLNAMVGRGGGFGAQPSGYPDDRDDYRDQDASDTVFVRNLPPSFTWQALKEHFKGVGDVRHCEMKGRGMALVKFRNSRSAKLAADVMDGIRIEGYMIEVVIF